jgi:hypothetical protein
MSKNKIFVNLANQPVCRTETISNQEKEGDKVAIKFAIKRSLLAISRLWLHLLSF